jgi:anaerobic glycerol-3-phosphate dehydrogenase
VLRSLLIPQLKQIRKEIQDERDAEEKKMLEEKERKSQEELARLLRQQAEEKKWIEALEAKRQKEQKMGQKLKAMQGCDAGYSWYQVLADFAD